MMAMVQRDGSNATRVRIHTRRNLGIKRESSFDLMPMRGDIEKMSESNAQKSGTCAKTILQCATVRGSRGSPGERIRSSNHSSITKHVTRIQYIIY